MAGRGGSLHFVEVRTGSGNFMRGEIGERGIRPEENMHKNKLQRLFRAVQIYLMERRIPESAKWQMDALFVFIDQKRKKSAVEYYEHISLQQGKITNVFYGFIKDIYKTRGVVYPVPKFCIKKKQNLVRGRPIVACVGSKIDSGRSIVAVHLLWEHEVRVRFSAPRQRISPASWDDAVVPKGMQSEFDSRHPEKNSRLSNFLKSCRNR